ncbi:cutinase transcription factor 1 beta [Parachaetomium inaequale]|uniref:Cutinase transcription factor 1 beta n=1 Tax=Parachaetomium inaequale TaxID=2588326 RepID=A0AAN6PCZ5_9PEZI|nr:cutinase transcription factor 1 beta [Parachaetomium inaequale]
MPPRVPTQTHVSNQTPPLRSLGGAASARAQYQHSSIVGTKTPPMSSSAQATSRPSRRAAVACKACSLRKVRCTVTLSGTPCANCVVDGTPCEVMNRKRRRNTELLPLVAPETPAQAQQPRRLAHPFPRFLEKEAEFQVATNGPSGPLGTSNDAGSNNALLPQGTPRPPEVTTDVASHTVSPTSHHSKPSDAAEDTSAYAETLEGGSGTRNGVPFYPGDRRGPAFLMDICEPHRSSTSNHCVVSMPSNKSLPPEDVNYLHVKGALTLPPRHIQDALVQCYFHHVHPFAPILDPFHFIDDYENNRASLLLLWSMFVASASFIDSSLLTEGFYQSHRALKRAVYQRAKALYDADYESDKVTLIQSVFLMGHWYTSSDDRAGPWHWNGVAIGLAHTVGLHRLSVLASETSRAIRPLWRRLWWSIYCREAWLSLGQGRPMRISLDDSDTALPEPHDKENVPPDIQEDIKSKYLPTELDELFDIWISFVKLGIALGSVLSTNYREKAAKPTRSELELGESEIRACYVTLPESITRSRIIASHYYQFKLYFEATIIMLYRPFILDTPRDISVEQQESWRSFACRKTRTAASNASGAVTSLMAEDLIGFGHTITVLALVPPMQIHVFESTSSKPMARQMAKHNLALCMLAMEELGKSYISAIAAYKLFDTAIQKVEQARGSEQASGTPYRLPPTAAMGQPGGAQSVSWENWPDGYATSTASVITDVWLPWTYLFSSEVWMDAQDSNGPLGNGDISHFIREWTD